MKKLAYFKIEENMTPRDASDILAMAKKAGCDDVLVYHHEKADITRADYKEQLLSVFRAAYRHKVGLYIADDRYSFSGTGFGQLSSVKDLWQRIMVVKQKDEVAEDEEILSEDRECGACVAVVLPKEIDRLPYGHMPDLTNPECARLIIESVYKPLLHEFKKFAGYEFKGFFCNCPTWDCEEYEGAPYCREAVDKFMETTLDCGDLFAVADMEEFVTGGWGEYLDGYTIDESFVLPLKRFCDENGLEFALATGCSSVDPTFGKENSSVFLNPVGAFESCYIPGACTAADALWAYGTCCEPVVRVGCGMEKLQNVGRIFEKYPSCKFRKFDYGKYMNLTEFYDEDKDCYILENKGKEAVSLGFLPEGDRCVYDWENDVMYEFDKKGTYTIFPGGFLCIVKRTEAMYPEPLPVRVCGVLTGELEEVEKLSFSEEGGKVRFTLPEESLSGKYVQIEAEGGYISVKMGYNRYESVMGAYVFPLYDFLCGNECEADAGEGKVLGVKIVKKVRS